MSTETHEDQGTEAHEDQRPARGPNATSKIYPVRIKLGLMAEFAERAKVEGVGVYALVNRAMREYLDRQR